MKKIFLLFFIAFTFVAIAQNTDSPEIKFNSRLDYLFGQHKIYKEFFYRMKNAILNSDSAKLAGMIEYPIRIRINKTNNKIRNRKEFLKYYRKIIDPSIIKAIEHQQYCNLFANSEGIMINNGEIWFTGICKDSDCKKIIVKIIAINKDMSVNK